MNAPEAVSIRISPRYRVRCMIQLARIFLRVALTIMVGVVAVPAALAIILCACALRGIRRIGGDSE